MKRPARLRRAPWVVLALGLAAFAAAGAVAIAGLQPADLTYTPNSESQVTNVDVARAWIKNYYGAPGAATGKNGAWRTPLNTASNYAAEAVSVAKDGGNWLQARSKLVNRAIVLDVDDTTLANWNYELFSNWDFNPTTNGYFVDQELFPAVPGMVDMVKQAVAEGYAIFFVTGRPNAQYAATLGNLTGAPYTPTVPAPQPPLDVPPPLPGPVNAGYPTPTSINLVGSANPADVKAGLFTKPPVGSYPAYLNKPEFCGPSITAGVSCPTIQYKSGTRAYIESQGYDIVGNFGDQFSDLLGGFADKTFKLPNPNYYLP